MLADYFSQTSPRAVLLGLFSCATAVFLWLALGCPAMGSGKAVLPSITSWQGAELALSVIASALFGMTLPVLYEAGVAFLCVALALPPPNSSHHPPSHQPPSPNSSYHSAVLGIRCRRHMPQASSVSGNA